MTIVGWVSLIGSQRSRQGHKEGTFGNGFVQDQSGSIADHEILLVDTKDTFFFITVVRIEEKSQVFGNIGLVKGNTVLYNAFYLLFPHQTGGAYWCVVVACNFNVIHTGCKGEVLVWNLIGNICFLSARKYSQSKDLVLLPVCCL